MSEQQERHITLVDAEGNETLFEVLDTFQNEATGKSYVFISEVGAEEDENGYVEIHAYSFVEDETGEGGDIFPIETEEEWEFVEAKMEEIEDQINAAEDEE